MLDTPTGFLSVLRRQLEPTPQMQSSCIQACHNSRQADSTHSIPFWQQVLQALVGDSLFGLERPLSPSPRRTSSMFSRSQWTG